MSMYCPKKIYRPLKAATELLAGIPSVVYGFFGMVIVVPIIRDFGRTLKMMGLVEKSGDGKGILTTSIVLGMMILPTIIGTTESAMRAVPPQYYEAGLYTYLDADAAGLEVMQLISTTGKLEPETEEKLRHVLEAYTENFLNTRPDK